MNQQSKWVVPVAIAAVLGAVATNASAVTISASNGCSTAPYCGASFLSGQWNKSPSAIFEEQYFLVDVAASTLLQATSEHLAMSTFAQDRPFNSSNQWVGPPHGSGPAPNGGLGVILGAVGSPWTTCPADASNLYVEFAVERFGHSGTTGTQVLDCDRVSKATLSGVSTLRVEVYASCLFGTCNVSATLSNPSTSQVYATVTQGGIVLQNPTGERDIWYGFLNASTPYTLNVDYSVIAESYTGSP
jgi:hypothetical protein